MNWIHLGQNCGQWSSRHVKKWPQLC